VAAPAADPVLRILPGPRADWFGADALERLLGSVWEVTSDADRVGVRLDGPRLERADDRELPSEGMVEGALQVPPSGRPVLFLADHPVTGGYPVIAIVAEDDIPAAAQARPGSRIRFRRA
jgi:allophanate hydrolase subunit 2